MNAIDEKIKNLSRDEKEHMIKRVLEQKEKQRERMRLQREKQKKNGYKQISFIVPSALESKIREHVKSLVDNYQKSQQTQVKNPVLENDF